MKQEIHIITNKGEMKGCDLYPVNSLHIVNIDQNGIRWTKQGRDSIDPRITSEKHHGTVYHGRVCNNCENIFVTPLGFNGTTCKRCHEKQTKVDR